MQFWQSLFLTEPDQLFEVVRICEAVGFDGVTVSDHLLHFDQLESRYLYSEDGKPPLFAPDTVWPESWSIISALAAITTRIRFATNVYILPLRNPIEVAKATASTAFFSGGRLVLGAGAGWMKEEFDVLGVDFKTRGRRFDECIEVMRKLWSGTMVEHRGEFFDIPRAQMCPAPTEPVPIYIGGLSPAALRRTAKLGDGWLGPGQSPEDAIESLGEIARRRAEAGRSSRPFDAIVPLTVPPDIDTLRRIEDAGAGGTVSYPFPFTIGPATTLEQKRAYLEQYAENVIAPLHA